MCGADQVDIVAALGLKIKHYGGQFICVGLAALAHLADAVVLAVDALEVAIGKEDSARAAMSYQGWFLSEVGPVAGNDSLPAGIAFAKLVGRSIHLALAWAYPAACKNGIGTVCPPFKFAGLLESYIRRSHLM